MIFSLKNKTNQSDCIVFSCNGRIHCINMNGFIYKQIKVRLLFTHPRHFIWYIKFIFALIFADDLLLLFFFPWSKGPTLFMPFYVLHFFRKATRNGILKEFLLFHSRTTLLTSKFGKYSHNAIQILIFLGICYSVQCSPVNPYNRRIRILYSHICIFKHHHNWDFPYMWSLICTYVVW